jgi:hypothetical protein
MRNVSILCDRCGQIVLEHGSLLTIEAKGDLKTPVDRVDLCGDCAAAFVNWLRSRAATLPAAAS